MRIALVSAAIPLAPDASRRLAAGLESALRDAGHQAETCLLPYSPAAEDALPQRIAYRRMEFAAHYDLVVTLRTPAEIIQHPRKVAWLDPDPAPAPETLFDAALAAGCARATLLGLREARRVLAPAGRFPHLLAAGLNPGPLPPAGDWTAALEALLA